AAYVATAFDPTSDQYLELNALAARLVFPGAGDTISSIVEQLTKLLAMIPSDLKTVLEGDVGAGLTGFGGVGDTTEGSSPSPGSIIGSFLPDYAIVLHPIEAGEARELVEDWYAEQVANDGGEVRRMQAGSVVVLQNPT